MSVSAASAPAGIFKVTLPEGSLTVPPVAALTCVDAFGVSVVDVGVGVGVPVVGVSSDEQARTAIVEVMARKDSEPMNRMRMKTSGWPKFGQIAAPYTLSALGCIPSPRRITPLSLGDRRDR